MNRINKLAILTLFFAILPFLTLLNLAVFDPLNFLDAINYLSFIFSLLIAPFIALILGIIVLVKRKNASRLFILLTILGMTIALGIYIFIYMDISKPHPKARDPKRERDIRQISLAMEMVCDETWKDESCIYPLISIKEGRIIDPAIKYLDPFPADPGQGDIEGCNDAINAPYKGFDNSSDRAQYCIYACLEDNTYFAASNKGTTKLEKAPTSLDCW